MHQVSKFDLQDVPGGSGVKNPPVREGDVGSTPLGREGSPGGGHGNPLQYARLENPLDRGTWRGNRLRDHR